MNKTDLAIVMPVYNEQASIRKVVSEWFYELENWTENFIFIVLNDGSRDGTLRLLERLLEEKGARLSIVNQENIGHGRSCIKGYQLAIDAGVEWILQIDSDGQCDPKYFFRFWNQRDRYDIIFGRRNRREDGARRILASMILKLFILFLYRVNCIDANVPYRLMNAEKIKILLPKITNKVDLANIALSILLHKQKALRIGSVNITFRERYGGEPSVSFTKFASKALELKAQLRSVI